MPYIIDANNLAGKLNLLNQTNFDQKLIKIIIEFNKSQTRKYILVFDSFDTMGDKITIGNVKIIYTPHDSYYKNADDKIFEVAQMETNSGFTVITDDNELRERMEKLNENRTNKIRLMKATYFANQINNYFNNLNIQNKKIKQLSEKEKNNITDELMKIWK